MMPPVGFFLFLTFFFCLCNDLSIHVHARLVSRRSTNGPRDATSASTFASASWIWTSNSDGTASASPGSVAFLKDFQTPAGQIASSALISMTAVGNFTLWINGQPIGASKDVQNGWNSAVVLRAALNATKNTFSVLVANSGRSSAPPPGFLAVVQISYINSSNLTFISDSSWLATSNIPTDFPTPFELSNFAAAAVAAPYGSGPWGQNVSIPMPDPTPLTLNTSTWIWSTQNASDTAAVGSVGFRKTFPSPSGKNAQSATVLLTADNTFALYINGNYIGSPPGNSGLWQNPQQFTTVTLSATSNVFTVVAQNFPGSGTTGSAAGFIAAISILYADGTSQIVETDTSWLTSNFTSLSEFLAIPDAGLSTSFAQGPMGMEPWGQVSSISDVLSAASVPGPPFSNGSAASVPSPISSSQSTLSPSTSHSVPVGTIVGAIWAVILVLLIALLIWWRRRRNWHIVDSEAKTPDQVFSELPVAFQMGPSNGAQIPSQNKHVQRERTSQSEGTEAPPPYYTPAVEQSITGRSVVAVDDDVVREKVR